ncbi:hypothetical protein Xen7305DRAFT_00003400 [Xenococcus sp. PCC 7305]|uniref:hypothetical protein n=1 Tax=Xenococcus sp. PCC 7305 TaxID=102125 RepID=UPI0002ACD720|nr:hypothetical protein [Xenococcus sp. PCC 7305]ELS00639.1 hypothetical protein Xen7305DRAFT_00003400 [Xenococcus sp. PCC 7305]
MKFVISKLFFLSLCLLNITMPGWAAMSFSPQQKADIIERINICQQPIFEDGYETSDFKISIFQEQDGSFVYCGYDKKNQAKLILPATVGDAAEADIIWQARNGNVVYIIKVLDDASYLLSIIEKGDLIYQAEAWSVYPP